MTIRAQTNSHRAVSDRGLEPRITGLEVEVSSLKEDVQGVARQVSDLGARFGSELGALRDSFSAARRPDWSLIISGIGVMTVLILAVGGSALTPLYIMAAHNSAKADESLAFEHDYLLGKVPSSAEPRLAAIDKMFTEVETQFRAFKDRMIENEGLMKEKTDLQGRHIEETTDRSWGNVDRLDRLEERVAGIKDQIQMRAH